jgi:hypothetical protein
MGKPGCKSLAGYLQVPKTSVLLGALSKAPMHRWGGGCKVQVYYREQVTGCTPSLKHCEPLNF